MTTSYKAENRSWLNTSLPLLSHNTHICWVWNKERKEGMVYTQHEKRTSQCLREHSVNCLVDEGCNEAWQDDGASCSPSGNVSGYCLYTLVSCREYKFRENQLCIHKSWICCTCFVRHICTNLCRPLDKNVWQLDFLKSDKGLYPIRILGCTVLYLENYPC